MEDRINEVTRRTAKERMTEERAANLQDLMDYFDPELAAAMKKTGLVILLSASPEILYARTEQDGSSASRRPALTESGGLAEVKELLARRRTAYLNTAHLEVDTTSLEPSEVADRIVVELRSGEFADRFSQIVT